MKVTLESTDKLVDLNGIPARVWEGQTEHGSRVYAFITRIAVHRNDDASEFERDLQEHRAPSREVALIPRRLIL